MDALLALGRALADTGYTFVTVGPETHRRVNARADATGRGEARTLRDVFGWSRPFAPGLLPPRLLELARAADVLESEGERLRARVRFSTLHDRLFAHSAYPTLASDAVFFGPDTYRFCDLVRDELQSRSRRRVVDVGCGSGAGGIVAGKLAAEVVLADINARALAIARVNAALSGLADKTTMAESDVLAGVGGSFDLVIANPPYMVDGRGRAYRDGGGSFGEALAVRIAREALARLDRGGQLILYTGAAIVDGIDTFLAAAGTVCDEAGARWEYREIDPDVFGEEIENNDAYAAVERIAAVALVATVR